jgi:hypothetical protein
MTVVATVSAVWLLSGQCIDGHKLGLKLPTYRPYHHRTRHGNDMRYFRTPFGHSLKSGMRESRAKKAR